MDKDIFYHFDELHWEKHQTGLQNQTIHPKRMGWNGFGDSCLFENGILLSRGNIYNASKSKEPAMPYECYRGIHIVLEADYCMYVSAMKQSCQIRSGQLWSRHGEFGEVTAEWKKSSRSRIVALDFNPDLLDRWSERSKLPNWLLSHDTPPLAQLSCEQRLRFLLRSEQILNQPFNTLYDQLTLESMVFALCSELIQFGQPSHNKIDDCLDIIHSEYDQPLTITSLAVRIGINECYLKQQFKTRTGKTIASYIRELRMRKALSLLLDENKSLKETAFYVGYKDSAYFSRQFKKQYGFSPADIKPVQH